MFKNARMMGLGLDDDDDIVNKHDDDWFIERRHTEAQKIAEMQPIGYAVSGPLPDFPMSTSSPARTRRVPSAGSSAAIPG
jgi:hypothetical protein